jgi:hypothetical protein
MVWGVGETSSGPKTRVRGQSAPLTEDEIPTEIPSGNKEIR